VVSAAAAKKKEIMESWKAMEGSLPGMVADIGKKLAELGKGGKLPKGLDKAGLAAAKTALDGATAAWTEAGTAFSAGDVMTAAAKASDVKKTAETLMGQLGMSAPAAAPAEAPAKK
jgi:hypothetical protein